MGELDWPGACTLPLPHRIPWLLTSKLSVLPGPRPRTPFSYKQNCLPITLPECLTDIPNKMRPQPNSWHSPQTCSFYSLSHCSTGSFYPFRN